MPRKNTVKTGLWISYSAKNKIFGLVFLNIGECVSLKNGRIMLMSVKSQFGMYKNH